MLYEYLLFSGMILACFPFACFINPRRRRAQIAALGLQVGASASVVTYFLLRAS